MLPKSERLIKSDFIGLRPKVTFRGTYVDIGIQKSQISKFSCIISKKRIKKAVERNRVRRKIYSILEEVKPKTSFFVLIYPKQTVISGTYTKIKEEISHAFDTLH
jgi:ribonuclease P protein component